MKNFEYWVKRLKLTAHPEGGYYRETYRAAESIPADALPERYAGARAFGTAILFLLPAGQCSRWHRVQSDETWHFYAGAPLLIYDLSPDGVMQRRVLAAPDMADEHTVCQLTIPAGRWFGAQPLTDDGFSLAGCTVAPGFDYRDFELADVAALRRAFPQHAAMIGALVPCSKIKTNELYKRFLLKPGRPRPGNPLEQNRDGGVPAPGSGCYMPS